MKFIPNAVTAKVARTALLAQKSSPTTLFVGGIIGVTATVVLACRATLKVDAVLAKTQEGLETIETVRDDANHADYTDTDAKKDKAYVYIRTVSDLGKLYGPALIIGIVSVSALAGSHNILSRRNAALAAAYKTVEKAFGEYRGRVSDVIGHEREQELYYDLTPCDMDGPDATKKSKVKRVGPNSASMYARFFDEQNRNWESTPEYNFLFLKCQQQFATDRLIARGHIFLNEVYDALGMERTKEGSVVGWVLNNGDNYVDFGIFEENATDRVVDFMTGRENCILLDFNVDGIIYEKI